MNVLSSLNNLEFEGYLDEEVYHLHAFKDKISVFPSLVVGKTFLKKLFKGSEELHLEKRGSLDDDLFSLLLEHFEAILLDDSMQSQGAVNIYMSSKSLSGGVVLNIIGFENVLRVLHTELKNESNTFFMIRRSEDVDASIEVFEENDFMSVYAYKGNIDVTGLIHKDSYLLSKKYVEVEKHEVRSQNYFLTNSEYSNYVRKNPMGLHGKQVFVEKQHVEKAARLSKRISETREGLVRTICVVVDDTLFLEKIVFEDDVEEDGFQTKAAAKVRSEEVDNADVGEEDVVIKFDELETYDRDVEDDTVEAKGYEDEDVLEKDGSRQESDVERFESFESFDFDVMETSDVEKEHVEEQRGQDDEDEDEVYEEFMRASILEESEGEEDKDGADVFVSLMDEDDEEDAVERVEDVDEDDVGFEDVLFEGESEADGEESVVVEEFLFSDDDSGGLVDEADFLFAEPVNELDEEIERYIRKKYKKYEGVFPQNIGLALEELEGRLQHVDLLKRAYRNSSGLSEEDVRLIEELLEWDF